MLLLKNIVCVYKVLFAGFQVLMTYRAEYHFQGWSTPVLSPLLVLRSHDRTSTAYNCNFIVVTVGISTVNL